MSTKATDNESYDPDIVVQAVPVSTPTSNDEVSPEYKASHTFDLIICGDQKISGRRIRPGRNIFLSLFGNTKIDMKESEFPPGTKLKFIIVKLCGDVKLVAPPGTIVNVCRISLCGDKDINVNESPQTDASPTITITMIAPIGSIRVCNFEADTENAAAACC
eukprot:scaffold38243_cov51-Attheya_sp.AAC.1